MWPSVKQTNHDAKASLQSSREHKLPPSKRNYISGKKLLKIVKRSLSELEPSH